MTEFSVICPSSAVNSRRPYSFFLPCHRSTQFPLTRLATVRYITRWALGAQTDPREEEDSVANQVGKRYQCTKCGTEMIVTKGGDGEIGCCGQPMQQKQ